MYSKDFIEKVRSIYLKEKSVRKTADRVELKPSTVAYIVKNNYQRIKKKRSPKKIIKSFQKLKKKGEVGRINSENQKVTASKIKINCDIDELKYRSAISI